MFSWMRKKKQKELEEKYGEAEEGLLSEQDLRSPEDPESARRIEQYIVEQLESMMETAREIDDEKSEYRRLTSYLKDVQFLEELQGEERKKIEETAVNVVQLNNSRSSFLNSTKKLSDAQFVQMQLEEDEMPAVIRRFSANEAYRDTLKKDMKYLDREKSEWALRKEFLGHQKRRLKKMLYLLAGTAVVAAVVLIVLQVAFQMDLRYVWTAFVFLAAVSICATYLKIQNDETDITSAERHINRAIVLQNKVKIKYVGMENAVDYACEKYHVRSSAELGQQWEYYLEAVRERERFQRTNEDLEYYNGKLVRQLAGYELYDSRVWVAQAAALVDPKEMVEIKHGLIARRQKVRGRIEYNADALKVRRREILQLLNRVGEKRPQMEEILDSIDRLSEV